MSAGLLGPRVNKKVFISCQKASARDNVEESGVKRIFSRVVWRMANGGASKAMEEVSFCMNSSL